MSAVEATIDTCTRDKRGALIGYLPAGFPTLDTSVEAAIALASEGVDIIELGVPYSDPVMDGTVIQEATKHALAHGFRVTHALEAVHRIRAATDVPVLLMSYWNPILQYGVERFSDDLLAAGGSGLITPDLIPDEANEWLAASDRTNLDRVFLAAPTSTDERLERVVRESRGFVYAVSTLGTTGARSGVDSAAQTLVERLRHAGAKRACVGLGISSPEHVRDVLDYADGAIVGSALVAALAEGGVAAVSALATHLARGTVRTV